MGVLAPYPPLPPYPAPLSNGLVYNVRDYGAFGDKVHDDTAAIQTAINTCAATGGGIVWLGPGTYLVTANTTPGQSAGIGAALYGLSGVRIMGAGRGLTTIKVRTGSATGRSDAIAYGFDDKGNTTAIDNVEVSDLSIDLTAITAVFGSGIRCPNPAAVGSDADFTNLEMLGCKDWGLSWGGFTTVFQRLRARHVVVNGTVYGGIWIGLTDYPEVEDLYVENCAGNPGTGEGCALEVESGNYGRFEDIRGDSLPIQMVLISGNLQASFVGISGTCASGAHGIQFAGVNNVEIADVNLSSPGGGGYGLNFSSGTPSGIKTRGLNLVGFTNFVNTQGASSVTDFQLSDFTFNGAGYGLVLGGAGSTATELNISSGTCIGNGHWLVAQNASGVIHGITDSGSGAPVLTTCPNLTIRDCPGYNPVGSSVPGTAFTLPASGTAWTNNTGVDGTLFVTGAGVVTDVVVRGVTVASSLAVGQSFFVPAGGTITFTYTASPTLVFVGN